MDAAQLTIFLFLGFILIVIFLIFLAKKLVKGSQKIAEKRMLDFEQFAKSREFYYKGQPETTFLENLKNFTFFNKKELNPELGSLISQGKIIRDVKTSAFNLVSGSALNINWNIFDYKFYHRVAAQAGGTFSWYCTVFHGTTRTKNFPKLVILRRGLDFSENILDQTPNDLAPIPTNEQLSAKYLVFGEKINSRSLVLFLEKLSKIEADVEVEMTGKEVIFYTKRANYSQFDTNKLQQVFSKIEEVVAAIPQES